MEESHSKNTAKNEKKAGENEGMGEVHCGMCDLPFMTDLTEPWGWSHGEWVYLCPVCADAVEKVIARYGYGE